jgi:hypothetical protein
MMESVIKLLIFFWIAKTTYNTKNFERRLYSVVYSKKFDCENEVFSKFRESKIFIIHISVVIYLVEIRTNDHTDDDYAFRKSSEYEHIEVVRYLLNTDIESFSNNEIVRNVVINHKLTKFYEKFGIK